MRPHRRLPAAVLAALALALGGAACGDDDDGGDETDTTIPSVTIPSDTTTTTAPTTTTEPTTTEDDARGNGGTPTVDPNAEDSPENDKPPAPGSPEEAFEQDCQANPGKCG